MAHEPVIIVNLEKSEKLKKKKEIQWRKVRGLTLPEAVAFHWPLSGLVEGCPSPVYLIYLRVPRICLVPEEARHWAVWTGVRDGHELPCRCWQPNPGPLQQQQPTPQPRSRLSSFFLWFWSWSRWYFCEMRFPFLEGLEVQSCEWQADWEISLWHSGGVSSRIADKLILSSSGLTLCSFCLHQGIISSPAKPRGLSMEW